MPVRTSSNSLSLDTWAVLLALAVAVVIRIGLVSSIPW